ncbi:MAG TPA: amidohydrolase family protein, partial [Candidatus Thermoplasmatota archaeon]
NPVVDRPSRLAEKAETIASKACVNWGLWATVTPQSVQVEKLIRESNGLKLFLSHTTGVETTLSDAEIAAAVAKAQTARRWVLVHAESKPGERVAQSTRDHDLNRPADEEVAAIQRLGKLLEDPDGVHIAHATTKEALEAARTAGFNAAVTPHHLLLSHETVTDAFGKVNPPLRSEGQRRSLLESFVKGDILQLESDHAPHTIENKRERFHEAPSGLPGVETMLPLMLQLAKFGDVPLGHVIEAACERPAQLLGVDAGFLMPGRRADFFVVDPKTPTKIRGDRLASRAGWSPYDGRQALIPTHHYLAGEPIVEDGEFIGRVGRGERIEPMARPEQATPSFVHRKP